MNEPRNKKRWLIVSVVLVVLAGGSWGLASYFSKPQEEQFAIAIPKDGTMEERMKSMEDFRNQMRREDLTDEQRRKLGESMRRFWEGEMQTRVNEYFEADPEERDRILDKHIDEMEEWRKAMEDRRRQEEEKAKAEGKTEEEEEKDREKEREEWRKRMGSRSREERKADSETRNPNEMAQRMAYFSAMRKQMEKRGIQPPGGPGGGPGGRGPGGGPRG